MVQAGGVVDHGSEHHATVIPIYVDWCGVLCDSEDIGIAWHRGALAFAGVSGAVLGP